MEESNVIYRFQKNPEEEVRFSIKQYKERQYLDLRLWFQPSDGGPYHPTKKGLTLSLEHLSQLRRGLEQVEKTAVESPLQRPAHSLK